MDTKSVVLGLTNAILFTVMSGIAAAQLPGVTVISENDWYLGRDDSAIGLPNDDDYTNGLRVSLEFRGALWWGGWVDYPDCSESRSETPCRRTTLVVGQNFYTPNQITSPDVIADDRPYAAWLYVGIAGHVVSERELRTIELVVGTTGKAALGRESQTGWHRIWGFPEPRGWAHQVKPVPGLLGVIGTWDHEFALDKKTNGERPFVWRELNPYYRLSAGNVFTTAAVGATARVGYNIQRRWSGKIPNTRFAEPSASAGAIRQWDVHAFGSIETRFVAWNALQHDTYTPRALPEISRVVRDYELGVVVGRGRLSGGFRWVFRSREFDGGRRSDYAGPFFSLASR